MANEESKTGVTSPPAGTGNAPGIGEAFKINFSTGQGVYSYKIVLPEGIAGFTPVLTLEYMHSAGHGAFGLGWRMPLRSISLRLDFGVPNGEIAERYMDSGDDLLPMPNGTYAASIETLFNRYSRVGGGWLAEERNGNMHELGLNPAWRLTDPGDSERVYEWLLERSLDPSGNAIEYRYLIDAGMPYLAEVRYAIYSVRLLYENRPDPRLNGRTGYLRERRKRCKKIELYINPGTNERLIRSWILTYAQAVSSNISLLASIQLISHGIASDGSTDVVRVPTTFQYSPFELERSSVYWMKSSERSSPPPLTDSDVAMLIMDNAPLPGVLRINNGRQYYWRNLGDGTWAPPYPVSHIPLVPSFARCGLEFIDMDASGTADLLVASGGSLHGYYENGGRMGWNRFVAFPRGRRSAPAWRSKQLRLSDINCDGRIDAIMSTQRSFTIWQNEGEGGWSDRLLVPKGEDDGLPDFSDPLVFLADMTGDGLDDLVRVRSGSVEYWPGLGYGSFGERRVMVNSPYLRGLTQVHGWTGASPLMLVDVDGDGCADLVRVTADGIEVYINRSGISFSNSPSLINVPAPIPGTVRAINMSGGIGAGLVWNSPRGRQNGYIGLEFGSREPSYLLNHIENGVGLVSKIFYRSAVEDFSRDRQAGAQWNTNFPFPYLVVAGTQETDLVSGRVSVVNYRYHEAHFEPNMRQFQGFRCTEREELGDESRETTRTVFRFLMAQERQPGKGTEHAALNGMLWRTEIYDLDAFNLQGTPYRIEESNYDLEVLNETPTQKRVFIYIKRHRVEDIDRSSDVRVEEKSYTYDDYGNVIREIHKGYGRLKGEAQPEVQRILEIDYALSSNHYLIDRPASIVIRDKNGIILSEERRYYDGSDFEGLPYGQTDRGLLTRKEQLVLNLADFNSYYSGMALTELGFHTAVDADGNSSIFINSERHARDDHGLILIDKDAMGVDTKYNYDNSKLFRNTLTTSLGVTMFEHDQATGQILSTTYPDGKKVNYAYDAQGRILAISLPGEALENSPATYIYNDMEIPNSRTARFRPTENLADMAMAVTYFDGHGKEFQQRVQVMPGRFIVSGLHLLNPWGDLKEEYEPTFDSTASFAIPSTINHSKRCIAYDALGRIVKTVNFNGGVSTVEYHPFGIISKDANDNDSSPENMARGQFNTPHIEEFDAFRNCIRTTEKLGSGRSMSYSYILGPLGELSQIYDERGVVAKYQYDRLGQRLIIQHRDVGERQMWYDGRGIVIRTKDAKGNDIYADFDVRGRLIRLKLNGKAIEEYFYDDLEYNSLDRLSKVVYPGGGQIFNYDEKGRLVGHEYRFDDLAAPQTLTYSYDRLGRKIAVTHSDGSQVSFTINYQLTANGWVQAIPNFVDQVEYDPRGLPLQIRYHNGVVSHMIYTSGPGRLSTQSTTGPRGQELEQLSFKYDRLEMLLSINDLAPGGCGLNEYTYDPLYQITYATSYKAGASVKYNYDYINGMNLAHISEKSGIMHYDDSLHPDRLVGITSESNQRFNLDYDNNGNILTLPGKTFHYNAKNELMCFQAANGLKAEYGYDHKGLRISKAITDMHGAISRIFYVGQLMEIHNGLIAYFIYLGSQRVAIVNSGKVNFVHGDHLGSTAFFTDGTGAKIGAIAYNPFGNVASSNGLVDFRTFGTHPFDNESGLYYMRHRYYAPEIGRFITPDPLALYQPTLHLHNAKALHLYAFVANDPLNKIDPTGLSFWSVFGAVIGVFAAIAMTVLTIFTFGLALGAILIIGLISVSYVVASESANTSFGEFARGYLTGLNSGLNAITASFIFGPEIGVTLGVINFLVAFDTIANSSVYQGILSWYSWDMPMSWLATSIGLVIFTLNIVPSIYTLNQVDSVKVQSISIDWKTGTIVMEGGWTSKLQQNVLGFNLGNFAYVRPGSGATEHEIGHTLNVAAFGSIYHFIGAIDENFIKTRSENAYAERIADSYDPNAPGNRRRYGSDAIIPMWV